MKKTTSFLILFSMLIFAGCKETIKQAENEPIKAYDIDFNWGEGGPNGFAAPGLWADADPAAHVEWYSSLGCNVIQSFAVSCNGYAWYKNGIVPEQPGLVHDFLTEQVKLAHQKNIKVFGYFCAGSNTRWGLENPDLSYGVPALPHIPYTTVYLDFLCASIEETTASAQSMLGKHTRMVTCLANWNDQDAAVVIPDAIRKNIGLYGFTKPVNGSIMPPVGYYLSHHPGSLNADARNIALLARTYNGLPYDYVKE